MSFLSKNLSVLAYANGFTLWHYTSPDAAAVVDAEGYFNPAAGMVRVGDIIIATVETAGPAKGGMLLVSANAGGTVDVNDMTPIGAVDSR